MKIFLLEKYSKNQYRRTDIVWNSIEDFIINGFNKREICSVNGDIEFYIPTYDIFNYFKLEIEDISEEDLNKRNIVCCEIPTPLYKGYNISTFETINDLLDTYQNIITGLDPQLYSIKEIIDIINGDIIQKSRCISQDNHLLHILKFH